MLKQELLELFSTFTREDWDEFDRIKNLPFQPTEEELEAQRLEQEQARINMINSKLTNLWITRPEVITKEFVIWLLTQLKAEQFIWDDFDWWIENQILLFGDIEKAFNDLVIRFL